MRETEVVLACVQHRRTTMVYGVLIVGPGILYSWQAWADIGWNSEASHNNLHSQIRPKQFALSSHSIIKLLFINVPFV